MLGFLLRIVTSRLYRSRHLSPFVADHEMLRASFKCVKLKQGLSTPWQRCTHPAPATSRRGFALGAVDTGFLIRRKKYIPELQLTAFHIEHEKTGAEWLHVDRNDKNNVFSIGFKTNPPDHTGVPHILEHTTLCGSQKYIRPSILRGIELTLA